MNSPLAILMLAGFLVVGCGTMEPPCPPGSKNVAPLEADESLARKAKKEVAGGRGQFGAAEFDCLTIASETVDGSDWANAGGKVTVTFLDVIDCLAPALLAQYALTECIQHTARYRMAKRLVGDSAPDEAILKAMSITRCVEQSRNVEVNADNHGLSRSGPDEWVPVVLLFLLQVADKAMIPTTGPAMFMIKPGSAEEACVDLPQSTEPTKKCAREDGCPEYEDGGEPDPDMAPPIPPPSVPQDPGGGDHL